MVADASFYVVDAEDRITQVSGDAKTALGPLLGHSLWEASPQARDIFEPHFARARATGSEVEFTTVYGGRLARRTVVPAGESLTVYITPLERVDATTLATLAASLASIQSVLADRGCEQPDRRAPGSLRALP